MVFSCFGCLSNQMPQYLSNQWLLILSTNHFVPYLNLLVLYKFPFSWSLWMRPHVIGTSGLQSLGSQKYCHEFATQPCLKPSWFFIRKPSQTTNQKHNYVSKSFQKAWSTFTNKYVGWHTWKVRPQNSHVMQAYTTSLNFSPHKFITRKHEFVNETEWGVHIRIEEAADA